MSLRTAAVLAVSTIACTTALVAVTETSASAAGPLRFSRVQYDSPGSDGGSNASLNAEWARVTNYGAKARVMTGYTIRDPTGHVYRFPTFRLRSGASVTLHTGSGSNTARDLYWRQGSYVWNNTGDRAILRNRGGTQLDVCSWGDGSGSTGC